MSKAFDILLVDDSAADAAIFQITLKEVDASASVCWVSSGPEALEFLRQEGEFQGVGSVRLIVLDVDMPGQNGLDVLRVIKGSPATSRVPVVMLSATIRPSDINLAYSLGANVVFHKPTSLSQYAERVGVLVQHWLGHAVLPFLLF